MTLSRSCCYLDESAASFALSPCCFATRGILWSWLAERMALGIRRDTFLSLYGPLSLVMLIGSWVIGLMVGFALIQCSLSFRAEPVSFGANFLFSGDTFFTLGTASLTSMSKLRQSVAVLEAGTGLAFLAIVIGYLPVLYQLFSRREK